MNVFIIRSGEDKIEAEDIKRRIIDLIKTEEKKKNAEKEQFNIDKYIKISMIDYDRKPSLTWKWKARKMLKEAQIVLFLVGEKSHKSRNIDFELKTALALKKKIVCYRLAEGNEINKSIKKDDAFTGVNTTLAKEISTLAEFYEIVSNYKEKKHIHLINEAEKKNADLDVQVLLEQYKFFAETSEQLVSRRQQVNSFYISANTALITVVATAFSLNEDWLIRLIVTAVLSVPGFLLNISWRQILEAYGINNSSKLNILGMIEGQLAVSLYGAEWEDMSSEYNKKQYVSFTDSEKNLPRIFKYLYGSIFVASILGIVFLLIK